MSAQSEVLSPEERVERVRKALAEVGYPDRHVYAGPDDRHPVDGYSTYCSPPVPTEVWWRALVVADATHVACWPCSAQGAPASIECIAERLHDPLTSPWPPVVPR